MDFDFEKGFDIFNDLLEKRPEINPDSLKADLQRYYIPFVKKLIDIKSHKQSQDGLIVGVSAIQGAGKTTQGQILEILLTHFGFSSVSLSIDDHYITHSELCELREKDPRFIRRGVTHDIDLAIHSLKSLKSMPENGLPILISGYDKAANSGDGERFAWVAPVNGLKIKIKIVNSSQYINSKLQDIKSLKIISITFKDREISIPKNMGANIPLIKDYLPIKLLKFLEDPSNSVMSVSLKDNDNISFHGSSEFITPIKDLPNGWRLVIKKPDFIFYDGWMLGARTIEDESVFNENLPALETDESKEFAKFVNKKLKVYEPLWELIEFMNVLFVKDYQVSLKWREQAEEVLRARGEGMTPDQIKEFVYYFWRSVHPVIHIKKLATSSFADQVIIINEDHSIGEIFTPEEFAKEFILENRHEV